MSKDPVPYMPDLSAPDVTQSPYTTYASLHEQGKVYWDERVQAWVVTSYQDCATLLRDERFSVVTMKIYLPRLPVESRELLMPLFNRLDTWMLFQDGDEHKRLRTPVTKAFDSRLMKLWEGKVQDITNALLEPLEGQSEFDLLEALAYPLPLGIICAMLGLPTDDQHQLRQWTTDIAQFIDNSTNFEVASTALASEKSISEYLRDQIARYRKEPADNLISYLLGLQKQNPEISDEDIIGNAVLIFAAGHETTTALISNTTSLLCQNPEAQRAVVANPELMKGAVEEALRMEPPVHRTGRIPKEDFNLRGVDIGKGERLSLILGAANRDPAHFENPDSFDITRRPNRHLAFSMGKHFCVGAHLARIQGIVGNRELFRRFPTLRVDPESIQWRPNLSLRSMTRCSMKIG